MYSILVILVVFRCVFLHAKLDWLGWKMDNRVLCMQKARENDAGRII